MPSYKLKGINEVGLIGVHEIGHLLGLLHPWDYKDGEYKNTDIYTIYARAIKQLNAGQENTPEQQTVINNVLNSHGNPVEKLKRSPGSEVTPGQLKRVLIILKRKMSKMQVLKILLFISTSLFSRDICSQCFHTDLIPVEISKCHEDFFDCAGPDHLVHLDNDGKIISIKIAKTYSEYADVFLNDSLIVSEITAKLHSPMVINYKLKLEDLKRKSMNFRIHFLEDNIISDFDFPLGYKEINLFIEKSNEVLKNEGHLYEAKVYVNLNNHFHYKN